MTMLPDVLIKQGDLLPRLRVVLRDDQQTIVDLSNATLVQMYIRRKDATESVDHEATIVDPVGGVVEFPWITGMTDVPGIYYVEWRVTWSTKIRTFPVNGYQNVIITSRL